MGPCRGPDSVAANLRHAHFSAARFYCRSVYRRLMVDVFDDMTDVDVDADADDGVSSLDSTNSIAFCWQFPEMN
jgi:hypothetical protein